MLLLKSIISVVDVVVTVILVDVGPVFCFSGVVAAGYTGSGFGLCLGWFGCYKDS